MTLEILSARSPVRSVFLRELPLVVGRSSDADIQVDDYWVSQYHCTIEEVDGSLEVHDLASRTGTFVNGTRVTRARLQPGDRLTLGRTTLRPQIESTALVRAAG
jgi:pSer/pThr/pTyr-binding forkhead associated (FHA) protein